MKASEGISLNTFDLHKILKSIKKCRVKNLALFYIKKTTLYFVIEPLE